MGPLRGFGARFFFAAGFRPYLSVVRTDVSPRLNPLMANAEGAPEDDPARPTRREEWRDRPRQGKTVVARQCRRPTDRADEREYFSSGRPFGDDDGNNASTPPRARTMGCCFSVEDREVSHPASHARDKYNRETDEASQTLMVRPLVPPRWSLHLP